MRDIPVFYSREMCADSKSFSPSGAKPEKVVSAWVDSGAQIAIKPFFPATMSRLSRAHDRDYVDAVLNCDEANGFGNRSEAVAVSLPYTTGSMVEATCEALRNGIGAVSPTSGFHHAGYDFGGGFCTFNGLMVAALSLSKNLEIGILDCDNHLGNGTAHIIERLNVVNVLHYSVGHQPRNSGERFVKRLPALVERFKDCDIVLYQAGADSHRDDPLGGYLTTEQMFERDRIVFSRLREMGIPVAWNLAGGYQHEIEKVIQLHNNTMKAFSESFFK